MMVSDLRAFLPTYLPEFFKDFEFLIPESLLLLLSYLAQSFNQFDQLSSPNCHLVLAVLTPTHREGMLDIADGQDIIAWAKAGLNS